LQCGSSFDHSCGCITPNASQMLPQSAIGMIAAREQQDVHTVMHHNNVGPPCLFLQGGLLPLLRTARSVPRTERVLASS